MNIFKKILSWIYYSSANPESVSLTLKALVPALVFFGIRDVDVFNGSIDIIVHFLSTVGMVITAGISAYGAIRKVYLTVTAPKTI